MTDPPVEHQAYTGRLAIPYLTASGVVNMTFRCIRDHKCKEVGCPKYMQLAGAGDNLYGVNDAFKKGLDIALCEGELDALIMSEGVGFPAIGISGADKWKPWWTMIFRDFRKVFVMKDADKAGDTLANRVQSELGMRAVICRLPDGEDVNSIYLKNGADYLREFVK